MSESAHMIDQRCSKRIAIGEKVDFRCNSDEDFRDATMVDFSETGMLLMMGEKYTEGTQFEVRVKEEESIYFTVKCMRIAHCSDINSFGYGCQIEEHRIESNK
ncbi:MAG: PilZ domain-containing protein [Gammaproteobacteria bacterium]|nr:PilZ domain-containing protein [Gammaproteobacteria bacterium]